MFVTFCYLEPGKPDPSLPKPLGRDTRARVRQKEQEGPTCWYYVLDRLRDRIKAPNTKNSEERWIEWISSSRKKKFCEIERSYAEEFGGAEQQKLIRKKSLRKDLEEVFLLKDPIAAESLKSKEHSTLIEVEKRKEEFIAEQLNHPFLVRFSEQDQYETLYDFLRHAKEKKIYAVNKKFLKYFQVTAEECYQKFAKISDCSLFGEDKPWEKLSFNVRSILLKTMVMRVSIGVYGLKISRWYPALSFQELLQQLKEKGPFAVVRRIVPGETVKEMEETFLGRPLLRLSFSEKKVSLSCSSHMILLIGAKKEGKWESVYYLDPNYASDPEDPLSEPIFEITYRLLTSPLFIIPLNGFKEKRGKTMGYGVHGVTYYKTKTFAVGAFEKGENSVSS